MTEFHSLKIRSIRKDNCPRPPSWERRDGSCSENGSSPDHHLFASQVTLDKPLQERNRGLSPDCKHNDPIFLRKQPPRLISASQRQGAAASGRGGALPGTPPAQPPLTPCRQVLQPDSSRLYRSTFSATASPTCNASAASMAGWQGDRARATEAGSRSSALTPPPPRIGLAPADPPHSETGGAETRNWLGRTCGREALQSPALCTVRVSLALQALGGTLGGTLGPETTGWRAQRAGPGHKVSIPRSQ